MTPATNMNSAAMTMSRWIPVETPQAPRRCLKPCANIALRKEPARLLVDGLRRRIRVVRLPIGFARIASFHVGENECRLLRA